MLVFGVKMNACRVVIAPIAADPAFVPRLENNLACWLGVPVVIEVREVLPLEYAPLAVEPCLAQVLIRECCQDFAEFSPADEVLAAPLMTPRVKLILGNAVFVEFFSCPFNIVPGECLYKSPPLIRFLAALLVIHQDALQIVQPFWRQARLAQSRHEGIKHPRGDLAVRRAAIRAGQSF